MSVISEAFEKLKEQIHFELGYANGISLRDHVEDLRKLVPEYHERPTGPGLWLCWHIHQPKGERYPRASLLQLTQEDLDRGAPFHTSKVFGPIPE